MIAKQVKGSDFNGALSYIQSKPGAERIGGNMTSSPRDVLTEQFRLSAALNAQVERTVFHASLSVPASERLSDHTWRAVARDYLDGMGFTANQYVLYRHTDTHHDHVHIIASRIRFDDGKVIRDFWDYRRGEKVMRGIEQKYGLTPQQPSWEKEVRAPTTGEMRQEYRTGKECVRTRLQTTLAEQVKSARSITELAENLRQSGIEVKFRNNPETGQAEGVSFALDGIKFPGGKLGRKYSYPALAQTIEENAVKRRSRNVYRERYQDYSRRVRERPEFADATSRVIDVAIAIMLFKEMVNQDERARILSQSDQVQEWRETLAQSEFLEQSSEYLTGVEVEAEQLMNSFERERGSQLEV